MEQKNWARVRQLIGYYRYDKAAAPHQRAVTHPAVRNRPVITMSATFKRLKPAALSQQILALTGEPETVTIARSASARLRILARHPGDHRLRQRGE